MNDSARPPMPPPPPTSSAPAVNPYAPPKAEIGHVSAGAPVDAERIRRELLSHESSVRAIGLLYRINAFLIFAIAALAAVGVILVMAFGGDGGSDTLLGAGLLFGMVVLYVLLGWLMLYLGNGLRDLNPKVRTIVTVFSVIGLLALPIGTLFSIFVLYLLHSEKGARVYDSSYRQVIDATPHIVPKTPAWLWILVALFVLLMALVVLGAVAGGLSGV